MLRLIAWWRRQRMLYDLLAAREPAPELRAFTLREFPLAEVRRLLGLSTDEEIRVDTRRVRIRMPAIPPVPEISLTLRQGDHPALMATGGIYAQLFTLQAGAYQSA